MKLLTKLFRRKPANRFVLLVDYQGDTKIVKAHKSQSGWIANWYSVLDNTWTILLPNGKVAGHTLVKSWAPHSGWDGTEFQQDDIPDNVVTLKRQA